jgi:CspA family cold shock protein
MSTGIELLRGTVKWWRDDKGYGFITQEDGTEIFVHYTGIVGQPGYRTLSTGDRVEYFVGENEKGPCAEGVMVVRR